MAFEHYDKCSLLLPMDGANDGTVFTDWSPNPKAVTANGGAKTVTALSKYYGSSGYFGGIDDYLEIPAHTDFNFGSGDFCVEVWVYLVTPPAYQSSSSVVGIYNNVNNLRSWVVNLYNDSGVYRVQFVLSSSGANFSALVAGNMALNQWYHIACVKLGNDMIIYVDGIETGRDTYTESIFTSSTRLTVGRYDNSNSHFNGGFIQDIRVTKGFARYTGNFTPPPRLIGELSNTNALSPVEDETGDPVERMIIAVPRNYPTRAFGTVSDVNGDFTLRAPATECSVFAIHEGDPIKNDLIQRVIPV